jgi:hypothetical protein
MLSSYRRHGLVVALALIAGLSSVAVRAQPHVAALPSVETVVARSGWQVIGAAKPVAYADETFNQWQVRDAQGHVALLYLATATSVQRMWHWNGELGYLGEGYQLLHRTVQSIRLQGSRQAPVTVGIIQRLSDREVIAYAAVMPDGIAAQGSDDPVQTGWDILRGITGPYYLVRVTVPSIYGDRVATDIATRLLAPVLSTLYERSALSAT